MIGRCTTFEHTYLLFAMFPHHKKQAMRNIGKFIDARSHNLHFQIKMIVEYIYNVGPRCVEKRVRGYMYGECGGEIWERRVESVNGG